jgi:hypothetical protein
MEALFALVAALVSLLGLNFAAMRWGTDSRPGMVDDHQRLTS